MKKDDRESREGLSRRGFLKGAGLGAAAGAFIGHSREGLREAAGAPRADVLAADEKHEIRFLLNGRHQQVRVRTGQTLLELLRDELDMTGTKLVCDHGNCGACTVLLDGDPVNSCLTLSVEVAGRRVETIEGLAQDGRLHPLQAAFVKEDALQCGFCTPGMIMSSKALLDADAKPSRATMKAALSGNICRCGTYENVFRAIEQCSKGKEGR